VEWQGTLRRILEVKPALRVIMRERCVERGDCLVIMDGPLEIEIGSRDVRFVVEGELAGLLSESGLEVFDEDAREEIEYWCVALTSPGFKRFTIKRK